MKPGIIYEGIFSNAEVTGPDEAPVNQSQNVVVRIFDTSVMIDDAETEEIRGIELADDPLRFLVTDNDEDKFTSIRAKSAVIQILSSTDINIMTFAGGNDSRFYAELSISVTSFPFFVGYVSVGDGNIRQQFQPDPNVISLTISDNLSLLRDVPLVDFNGVTPKGVQRLADILAWSFSLTGLSLDIIAVMNLREVDTPDEHFFHSQYIDMRTLEAEIGTCISAYEAIRFVLGENCFAFQRKAKWHIMRVDEWEVNDIQEALFLSDGSFDSFLDPTIYTKQVGVFPALMNWMNDDAEISTRRAVKEVIHTYSFETPKETVPNIDFSRGELVQTVSPTEKYYKVDDWRLVRGYGSVAALPNCNVRIRRSFTLNGEENERYLVFTQPAAPTGARNWIQSDNLPMGLKDKFDYQFDYSAENGNTIPGPTTIIIGAVVLFGEDGSVWILGDNISSPGDPQVPEWKLSDADLVLNFDSYEWTFDASTEDITEWRTHSISAPPVPVAGNVQFLLYAANQTGGSSDNFNARYSNLSVTYIPFINGSYQKYSGQKNTVSQELGTKLKRDEVLKISNSPRKLYKGALQRIIGFSEIFSGSVTFSATSDFSISGYWVWLFREGMRIDIQGTASNNQQTTVLTVFYHTLTNETEISISGTTTAETISTVINEIIFGLSTLYYDFVKTPSPSLSDYHSYGWHIVFGAWNQFRRVMTFFEGDIDRLMTSFTDSNGYRELPDVVDKWILTDPHQATNNRYFQLLHFEQDFYLCSWYGVFVEVYNTVEGKIYDSTYDFKYIT